MTAPLDVKALRELLAKATPGPWMVTGRLDEIYGEDGARWICSGFSTNASNNGRLVAAMHNALPALLDAAEAWHEHEVHADTFAKLDGITKDLLALQRSQLTAALARAESAEETLRVVSDGHDRLADEIAASPSAQWSSTEVSLAFKLHAAEADARRLRELLAGALEFVDPMFDAWGEQPTALWLAMARAALTAGDGPGKGGGG